MSKGTAVSGFSLLYTLLLLITSLSDIPARQAILQQLDINAESIAGMMAILERLQPLESAAALFLNPTFAFNDELTAVQDRLLNATLHTMHGVEDVNEWVEQATKGKIPKILEELSPDEIMVLVSALHFKANWTIPFTESLTEPAPFTPIGAAPHDVSMMHMVHSLPVFRGEHVTGVVLDYDDAPSISAVIGLPNVVGEQGLRDALNETIANDFFNGQNERVDLKLPRFRVETGIDCMDTLRTLGLDTLIDDPFPVAAIVDEPQCTVSQAVQKVFLEVNEWGTEAAGATAIAMCRGMPTIQSDPIELTFDRPFVFSLVDNETGLQLFTAVISNIEEAE